MLHRLSVPLIVIILWTGSAPALDMENLKPRPGDLERVKKFEALKTQEGIGKAKQYESLKEGADLNRVQSLISKDKEPTPPIHIAGTQGERQKYLFFLFSKSVPDSAIESVFAQAQKLKGINFYGVLRGVDRNREVLTKIQGIKNFGEITVKVNPLIFRHVNAEAVPAFVYAQCAAPQMFRSGDCEYRMILYGDLSLIGALEKMADEDKALESIYQELKDAF